MFGFFKKKPATYHVRVECSQMPRALADKYLNRISDTLSKEFPDEKWIVTSSRVEIYKLPD